MSLVEEVYKLTKNFPKEELYGLTSQIRRAVVSIPANITEGYERNHTKEYVQFLYVSKASASEVDTLLDIANRLNLSEKDRYLTVKSLLSEIIKMLAAMIIKLKDKISYEN